MVTIPRNNGPIPPPRKPSRASPFVGPEQAVVTTRDVEVHKLVSDLVDQVHECDVAGIAIVAVEASGTVVIRFHTTPQSTAPVNMALDKLKSMIIDGCIK